MKIDYKRFFYMNASPNAIISAKGKYVEVNDVVCRNMGYSRTELVGESVMKVIHPDDLEKTMKEFGAMSMGATRMLSETTTRGKDGVIRHFLTNAEVDTKTGLIYLSSAEISDLKELTKLLENKAEESTETLSETVQKLLNSNHELEILNQEKRETNQKLKDNEIIVKKALFAANKLSKLKSKFITLASHEFRTPLTTILSSTALIQRYTTELTQPKRDKHLRRIKNMVKSLEIILEDFFSLDKLEEGLTENNPATFNFEQFFEEDIKEKITPILKNGQRLHFHYQESSAEIYLDKKLLKAILFNVITNAIKFSNNQASITIIGRLEREKLFLNVNDEGIGIPKKEIEHIFDRFYRAENAEYHQGTGIGLHIVKRYVELMNGQVSISSKLDKGTKVQFIFPVNSTNFD